ncbi:MAG: acylphosphatase [bacterium]
MSIYRMAHIYVGGVVQGVGFRFFVERYALKLGLVGWVRNLNDGRVEIYVEGDEKDIDSFIDIIKNGPPGSRISNISIESEVVQKLSCQEFVIKHTV